MTPNEPREEDDRPEWEKRLTDDEDETQHEAPPPEPTEQPGHDHTEDAS